MCPVAEPAYFHEEIVGLSTCGKSLFSYLALYKDCPPHAVVIGEATPTYLSDANALHKIRDFNQESKLLVLLRNPIEASYSYHQHLLIHDVSETEPDFRKAWRTDNSRYKTTFLFGQQVSQLLELFSPDQVHIILYDDFCAQPDQCFAGVLEFLGLRDVFTDNVLALQQLKIPSRPWFPRINEHRDRSGKSLKRKPLDERFRKEMMEYYRKDIELLESIVGRDLHEWKK
jgi:hypothetical protein